MRTPKPSSDRALAMAAPTWLASPEMRALLPLWSVLRSPSVEVVGLAVEIADDALPRESFAEFRSGLRRCPGQIVEAACHDDVDAFRRDESLELRGESIDCGGVLVAVRGRVRW